MFGDVGPRLPGQINQVGKPFFNQPALVTPAQIAAVNAATAALLPRWTAALNRVRAGTGNARWAKCGDSTTRGHGALGQPNLSNYLYSSTAYLSRMFAAAGFNSHFNGTYGADAASASAGSDGRVTVSGGFTSVGGPSFGGAMFLSNAVGTITYTPTVPVDSFFIFYLQQPTAGSFSYTTTVGGVTSTATTVTTTGTQSMQKIAVPVVSLGIGSTLTINWVSGQVFVNGFWSYDSSKKWVQIDNGGYEGSTTTQWVGTTNAYDPMKAAVALAPDLISICLGINDWDGGIAIPTYMNNLQSLITLAKTTSDVILITPNPSNPGTISSSFPPPLAVQQQYAAGMAQLAVQNNVPLVDTFNRIGSWATFNTNGQMFDNLHPNSVGYSTLAASEFALAGNPL